MLYDDNTRLPGSRIPGRRRRVALTLPPLRIVALVAQEAFACCLQTRGFGARGCAGMRELFHCCCCPSAPCIVLSLIPCPALPALGIVALNTNSASLRYDASILQVAIDHALGKSALPEERCCLLLAHVAHISFRVCGHSSRCGRRVVLGREAVRLHSLGYLHVSSSVLVTCKTAAVAGLWPPSAIFKRRGAWLRIARLQRLAIAAGKLTPAPSLLPEALQT